MELEGNSTMNIKPYILDGTMCHIAQHTELEFPKKRAIAKGRTHSYLLHMGNRDFLEDKIVSYPQLSDDMKSCTPIEFSMN